MTRALINVPGRARAGEVIEIKTLIAHPMETGYRVGPEGRLLPRDIIRRFACAYDGEVIFSAELHPAVAELSDGSFRSASADVIVTLAACVEG